MRALQRTVVLKLATPLEGEGISGPRRVARAEWRRSEVFVYDDPYPSARNTRSTAGIRIILCVREIRRDA